MTRYKKFNMRKIKIIGLLFILFFAVFMSLVIKTSKIAHASSTSNNTQQLTIIDGSTPINTIGAADSIQLCFPINGVSNKSNSTGYKFSINGGVYSSYNYDTSNNCFLSPYFKNVATTQNIQACQNANNNTNVNLEVTKGSSSAIAFINLCGKVSQWLGVYKTSSITLSTTKTKVIPTVTFDVGYTQNSTCNSSCNTTKAPKNGTYVGLCLILASKNSSSCSNGDKSLTAVNDGVFQAHNVTPNKYDVVINYSPSPLGNPPYYQVESSEKLKNLNASMSQPISIILVKNQRFVPANASSTSTPAQTPSSGPSQCESSGFSLAWVICPVINAVTGAEQSIEKYVQDLLQTKPISFTSSLSCSNKPGSSCSSEANFSSALYHVWSNFRLYGDIILVIAMLAIVYGEAAGGGMIEAYTVRKVLPRILVAAILINLSIYIVAGLEDIFNILGAGISSIIEAPFRAAAGSIMGGSKSVLPGMNIGGGTGLLGVGALSLGLGALAFGVLTAGSIGILLLVVIMALVAVLGIFITVIVRQGLLVFLLLISPVAFALYVLPNTEQYFKKWWGLLIKTLTVYPIVTSVFAMAYVSGVVMSDFDQTIKPTILAQCMALIAVVAPLFLIPFAFRMSGGVIGSVSGAVSKMTSRVNKPLMGMARKQAAKNFNNTLAGKHFKNADPSSLRHRLNQRLQSASLIASGKAGLNPARIRGNLDSVRSEMTSVHSSEAEKSAAVSMIKGNDDLLRAALYRNRTEEDIRSYLEGIGQTGAELDQNVSSIIRARKEVGVEAFEDFAAANLAGTGTGYRGGPAEMLRTINRVAGRDRARAARMLISARQQAQQARRVDLYGAGVATSMDQLSQLYTGNTNDAAVNEIMTDEVMDTKSAGEIGSARNNSLQIMVPAMQRRLGRAVADVQTARQSGNQVAIANAERQLKRTLAHTSSFLDIASQLSPENNAIVGAVMGQNLPLTSVTSVPVYGMRQVMDKDGNPAIDTSTNMPVMERAEVSRRAGTLGEVLSAVESDREFQQYKKVLTTNQEAAAANMPPPGPPGPAGPPIGPPGPPAPSDIRLKQEVRYLYTTDDNVPMYTFKYIGKEKCYIGVMAQDIIAIHPEAVYTDDRGYYLVDYSSLGVEMIDLG